MNVKTWAITLGVGATAGAVGILMMSRTNPTRKLAAQAADKIEDTALKVSDKLAKKYAL